MNFTTVWQIVRKEILDILRDRKAVFFMIALPILITPAMTAGLSRLMISQKQKTMKRQLIVQATADDQHRWKEMLRSRLRLYDATTTFFLRFLDAGVADALQEMAADLDLTVLEVLALAETDERVRGHARFADVGNLAESVRGARRKMSLSQGEDAGPEEDSELDDAAAVEALRRQSPEEFERAMRMMDLLSPLTTIDYRTAQELDDLEAVKPAAPLETFPEEVRQSPLLSRAGEDISSRRIHAYLRVPENFGENLLQERGSSTIEVLFDSTVPLSNEANRRLSAAVKRLSQDVFQHRLASKGLPSNFATPVEQTAWNLAPPEKLKLQILAGFLPYMIIIMCFFGGFYPAIDLGAGEKERYTLETLLVTPVSRLEIATGKFLVIFLASVIAAVCATASMAYSFQSGLASPELRQNLDFQLSVPAGLLAGLLIIPTAATFASILLAMSIYAKSFKEAQALMAPLQFLIIVPAIIAIIPDIELNYQLAMVPILNIALGLREILGGGGLLPPVGHVVTIFGSSILLAGLALWFVSWCFDREQVLFRS